MDRILVVVFSSLSKEICFHGSSDVKFYITTFQKKEMIRKTSVFTHKSQCLPLKILKIEERSNNVGKAVVILPLIFRETLGALVDLVETAKA